MAKELIINASLPELRIALSNDGEIQELLIERESEAGIVGNIYKGVVTRVLPGMQAAFVDIGLEKAAFLYVDDVYVHRNLLDPKTASESTTDRNEKSNEGESDDEPFEFSESDIQDVESEDDDIEMEDEVGVVSAKSNEDQDDEDTGVELVSDAGDAEKNLADLAAASDDQNDGEVEEPTLELAPGDDDGDGEPSVGMTAGPSFSTEEPKKITEPPAMGRGRDDFRKPNLPESFHDEIHEKGTRESDRWDLTEKEEILEVTNEDANKENIGSDTRPYEERGPQKPPSSSGRRTSRNKSDQFKQKRGRDKRIRAKSMRRGFKANAKIDDLLKEGQEIIVQVAKDPIAAKGARLTCHVSLAGRHLVCMPTVDHLGVSRRIERSEDRRRLRGFVEKHRTEGMGFIVRTASSGTNPEEWIKHDIDYLTETWAEISKNVKKACAPELVYQDMNSILRAVRDWVNEDVTKIVVDSRYHYDELKTFVEKFMPIGAPKIDLYQGDIPLFDAYGISTELNRALERRVWLKSGGYIVIDQAEALVAIDVNTGRYVGARNLEDTILKTNLEAVREVAYQMRLRNCGGIIIIDLIDMEREENRQKVVRLLEEELKKDRASPSVVRISDLGLIEMTRKRTRDTMVRVLGETCAHCEGKGFIKSKRTVAYELLRDVEREGIHKNIKRILIQAHPDVIEILAIDEKNTLDSLERKYGKKIFLQAVFGFHPEQFEIIPDKDLSQVQVRPSYPSRDNRSRNQPRGRKSNNRNSRNRNDKNDRNDRNRIRNEPNKELGKDSEENQGSKRNFNSSSNSRSDRGGDQKFTPNSNKPGGLNEEEEDRLAFLRAQAAQDAAIAGGGTSSGSDSKKFGGHGGGGGRGPGRRGNNYGGGRGGSGRNQRGRSSGSNGPRGPRTSTTETTPSAQPASATSTVPQGDSD